MAKISRRKFLHLTGAASASLTVASHASTFTSSVSPVRNPADSWLEIDLNNLGWNLAQIRARVNNRPVMAVIKANAYGHGLLEVGKFLERQKIAFLAVGKLEEALQLRAAGVKTPILNLGPFAQTESEEIVRQNISQSIYTDDFVLLAEAGRKLKRDARVHVKIDTGLGRVGVPYDQASAFIEKLGSRRAIKIDGVFTAFTEDDAFDRLQLQRLQEIYEAASAKRIALGLQHAASSAGVISFPESHLDMVRPGIAIYGQYPSTKAYQERRIDLRPVMSLKTRVMYVKTLRPGESVSYHRAFTAQTATRVATIAIGYSDGYPYQAAGKAEVLIHGRRWPSIALVTSNHMTIDVTGDEQVKIGDEVVLFGKQGQSEISAEELAAWAGTSVYKILIWMNPLMPRVFV